LSVLCRRFGVLLGHEVELDDGRGSPGVDKASKDVHLVVVEDRSCLSQGFEIADFLPLVSADLVFPEIRAYAGNVISLLRGYMTAINKETVFVDQSSVAHPNRRRIEGLNLVELTLP